MPQRVDKVDHGLSAVLSGGLQCVSKIPHSFAQHPILTNCFHDQTGFNTHQVEFRSLLKLVIHTWHEFFQDEESNTTVIF